MKDFSHLNTAQRDAVMAIDGPVLVLAGAGAGKTRVIVERIAEIIRQGTAPEKVLAVTFTNKAASEMRTRVAAVLEKEKLALRSLGEVGPFVSTFHSLGLLLIKENFKSLGYKRRPTIYDRADSLREMKRALKEVGAEDIETRTALGIASRNKGEGIDAVEYAESASIPFERQVGAAWLKYEAALRHDGALDFDDLLMRAVEVLKKNPDLRAATSTRWSHIHIDEYQDTNAIQAELAELLVGPAKNICAVGDIDQTIYSWRGAQIVNLMKFEDRYPGAKIIILDQNYRSTKNILAAANEIIIKNIYRREKNLFTDNPEGSLLSLYMAFDETDEAGFVVRMIKEMIREGRQPKDFAVLYRANFQSRAIEEQLLAADIDYQVLGTRFFERKEVKDTLSFIRAAQSGGPADIARIANVPPRGIGKVTLLKLLSGQPAGDKVESFLLLIAKIKMQLEVLKPAELVSFVVKESGMERTFKEDKLEGAERLENLRELVALASRYQDLDVFLESAALASDQDELKDEQNAVRLMTVHASKGLEFPVVFITGLEEGLFPYERQDSSGTDKEEERRLMYVAITRAQQKVYLTYASYRTVFGSKNATIPSQFLSDIPTDLIKLEGPERLGKTIYLD